MQTSLLFHHLSVSRGLRVACRFACVLTAIAFAANATSAAVDHNVQPATARPAHHQTDRTSGSTSNSSLTNIQDSSVSGFDGPAELPRVYIQSALINTPANGRIWNVSDSNGLQNALNSSACGDVILLQAGLTFSGLFSFPHKNCDDQHWIIVRTSAPDSSLPAEGSRISPCYAGVSSLPGRPMLHCVATQNVMAKLVMVDARNSGPIRLRAGANHYRFIGLEITRAAKGLFIAELAYPDSGGAADHLIFDRVWMHGTAQDDTARGLLLTGMRSVAVVDSYFNDFHCELKTGRCTDSQTILGGLGNAHDGPFKIVNNFLEAAAEGILFGGGGATTSPTDIEVRHNHFFKPLIWMPGYPGQVFGNHGNPFIAKNHFELKNAQRVLFDGNLTENAWGGFSQEGFSLLLTPRNQDTPHGSVCPLCQVTDVTVRFSKFSHMGSGFQLANPTTTIGGKPLDGERYSIHDVILEDIDEVKYTGQGQVAEIASATGGPLVNNLHIAHVTAFAPHTLFYIGDSSGQKMSNFLFQNSIVTTGNFPVWSVGGSLDCANYDVPIVTMQSCFSPWTFSSNALVGVPAQFPPSAWPSGNLFLPNVNAVGFVTFNNGNGGDYHLLPTSPCKNKGSDGKDLGADVDAINAATAGAY